MSVAKDLFSSQSLLKDLNSTFILLIPKKPNANFFQECRPISLCNYIYNIFQYLGF